MENQNQHKSQAFVVDRFWYIKGGQLGHAQHNQKLASDNVGRLTKIQL